MAIATPGWYVTMFRTHDTPVTYRCRSEQAALADVTVAEGGWWQGYRVLKGVAHEITLEPEAIERSSQAFPKSIGSLKYTADEIHLRLIRRTRADAVKSIGAALGLKMNGDKTENVSAIVERLLVGDELAVEILDEIF